MGDSNEPELFMQNYYEAIRQYTRTTHARITKGLTATAEWFSASKANASIGAFIDDIIRIVTPTDQKDDRALAANMNHDSRELTNALDGWMYAQNAEKADITLYGRRTVTHRLAGTDGAVIGRIMPHLLHLGSSPAGSGANGPEVDRVILAINRGW